ncbi:MAG: hypothetical protein ACREBV_07435 [Candidatus Zixiibacteriota bacterium]
MSFSQGVTLDKGQSGASLIYGYSDADDGSVQSGTFVNTTKGFLDVGVTIASINPDGFGDNVSLLGVQAEVFPLRESETGGNIPFNVSVFGLWSNTGPNNTTGYGFGGSVFKKLRLGKSAFLSPVFLLAKLWPLGSDYRSEKVVEFDFPLVAKVNDKLRISITPSFTSSDSQDLTSIFFGLTFVGVHNPKQ